MPWDSDDSRGEPARGATKEQAEELHKRPPLSVSEAFRLYVASVRAGYVATLELNVKQIDKSSEVKVTALRMLDAAIREEYRKECNGKLISLSSQPKQKR